MASLFWLGTTKIPNKQCKRPWVRPDAQMEVVILLCSLCSVWMFDIWQMVSASVTDMTKEPE